MVDEELLSKDEKEQKRKSRNRIFFLVVGLDVLMVAYLIYELIMVFVKK